VLPLARPGVIAAMTLQFVLAIRELGSSLFLYTSNTMVMAVLLLDYYEGGNVASPPRSAWYRWRCSPS
jgi:iron(III) transport system permease protein